MRIAVIFDSPHPEWDDAAFKREVEQKTEEAEYDVARALLANGHDVLMIGIGDDVAPLLIKLAAFQPKLVFNGCEGFRKNARHEYAIAALLDMYGRSEEHTSELQSHSDLVCRLLLEKKK